MVVKRWVSPAVLVAILAAPPVWASTLSAEEIRAEMLDRTIVTWRFGMRITMRYRSGGAVTASAMLGAVEGAWTARDNQICSTFPRGPAKGTSCVSFRRDGPGRYVSSEGVRFRVID